LGTKYLVVLCVGSALQLAKQSLDEAPYKLSGAIAKLASITFLSLAFSYWFDKPWFLTEGKTCCYIHQTFSWGFPTGRLFTAPSIAIICLQRFLIQIAITTHNHPYYLYFTISSLN
jgi:hypothetical protein